MEVCHSGGETCSRAATQEAFSVVRIFIKQLPACTAMYERTHWHVSGRKIWGDGWLGLDYCKLQQVRLTGRQVSSHTGLEPWASRLSSQKPAAAKPVQHM